MVKRFLILSIDSVAFFLPLDDQMEDDDFEHKTIDEVLESEQKKKKKQKLLEKVRISYFIITPFLCR